MFIKTKKRFRTTYFYLAESRRMGKKVTCKCIYIGNRLDLSRDEWLETAGRSGISIVHFSRAIEKSKHRPPHAALAGLREAMRNAANGNPELAILGLKFGATAAEIVSAFRALSLKHHPDYGGDPARFRGILAARDRLLSRSNSAA